MPFMSWLIYAFIQQNIRIFHKKNTANHELPIHVQRHTSKGTCVAIWKVSLQLLDESLKKRLGSVNIYIKCRSTYFYFTCQYALFCNSQFFAIMPITHLHSSVECLLCCKMKGSLLKIPEEWSPFILQLRRYL